MTSFMQTFDNQIYIKGFKKDLNFLLFIASLIIALQNNNINFRQQWKLRLCRRKVPLKTSV